MSGEQRERREPMKPTRTRETQAMPSHFEPRRLGSRRRALASGALLVLAPWITASAAADDFELSFVPKPGAVQAEPPLPDMGSLPVQLVLDDNESEGQTGFNGNTASQFLWFNRFTPETPDFTLTEVWVLFEPGPNMAVDNAIEIVVYQDDDGDPTNGAALLASLEATIQVLDGTTFSIYPTGPIEFRGGGDLLVGVISRFVESGVTSPTFPASVDTTATQDRSWFVAWSGDPPSGDGEPSLPSDNVMIGVNGNWMIRAFGTPAPAIEIPALSGAGPLILALALGFGAWVQLRRRTRVRS